MKEAMKEGRSYLTVACTIAGKLKREKKWCLKGKRGKIWQGGGKLQETPWEFSSHLSECSRRRKTGLPACA